MYKHCQAAVHDLHAGNVASSVTRKVVKQAMSGTRHGHGAPARTINEMIGALHGAVWSPQLGVGAVLEGVAWWKAGLLSNDARAPAKQGNKD